MEQQPPIKQIQKITVGDLRRHLGVFEEDDELIFGSGGLEFLRTKKRGDNLVQIEFTQNTSDCE